MILPGAGYVESEGSHPKVLSVPTSSADDVNLVALLENLPDHFWVVDLDYRLTSINRVARRFLAELYGFACVPGSLLLSLLPQERAVWWRQQFEEVLRQGRLQFESEMGHRCTFDFHLTRIEEENRVTGIAVYARELTAQKSAEDQLAVVQKKLRLSDARYRIAFENTPDIITINRGSDGRCVECNHAFCSILGYTRDEALGRTALELNLWHDVAVREAFFKEMRTAGNCRNLAAQFRTKSGRLIWGEISADFVHMEGESYILSVMRDVTASKEAEQLLGAAAQKLRMSEARYSAVFHSSSDGILIFNRATEEILDVNPRFSEIFGYRREELVGRTQMQLGLWDNLQDRDRWMSLFRQSAHCREFEACFRQKDGQRLWAVLSATTIEIDRVICTILIVRDVTEAKAAQDEIRTLAFSDALTGLANRRQLLDQLQKTLSSNAATQHLRALLFIDLDNFKMLNDTLGHQNGDLMLREVGRRLAHAVRATDLVARLSGDEFVVLLEQLNSDATLADEQVCKIARKILAVIRQPYLIDGRECQCSASIGVTVFDGRNVNRDELLRQADIALYEAKSAGRNSLCFFAPSLQVAVNVRATLEEEMRLGLRNHEFELFFQAQIERGRLSGAESLLRWRHPRHGLLLPGEFIGVAENSGLILPLGEHVLTMACQQIARWSTHPVGAKLTLAVNISSLQLRQDNFVDTVLAVLARTGADPRRLTLELTESMLVDNMEKAIVKMGLLKEHGIHFSLDDFGTGYSSLAYLKRLPLDQLKIDRSFIRDVLVDKTSGAIAQTIVTLGRAMRLSVVAEGVETEEQCHHLNRIGCQCLQGFYFGRPLPLGEFEARWLESDPLPYLASPTTFCET